MTMSFVPSKFLLTLRPYGTYSVIVSVQLVNIFTTTAPYGRDEEEWNQIDKLVATLHAPYGT